MYDSYIQLDEKDKRWPRCLYFSYSVIHWTISIHLYVFTGGHVSLKQKQFMTKISVIMINNAAAVHALSSLIK